MICTKCKLDKLKKDMSKQPRDKMCLVCKQKYQSEYYKKNKIVISLKQAKHYKLNRVRIRERQNSNYYKNKMRAIFG